MPFTKTSRQKTNAMPSIKTLRKYYPDCKLSDVTLLRLAEWVKEYSGKNFISPDNKLLAALIKWESEK